ncbi:MAG: RIP metalloprotease RseP [Coxiellaceae bacterium]|nr:RIP metalloprotease RseP [Coxiellaceae bacterium]
MIILNVILAIFGALVAIAIVILVHEWGHFVVARLCGVHVEKFSIGFGRAIVKIKGKHGTEYKIGWVPFGGFVKMLGDDPERLDTVKDPNKAYFNKPIYQRLCIVSAGVAMNFVLACVLYTVIFCVGYDASKPIVGQVAKPSIAQKAGLQSGDEFIRVEGVKTEGWQRVIMGLAMSIGDKQPLQMTVKNTQGQTKVLAFDLKNWRLIGVKPQLFQSLGFVPQQPAQKQRVQYAWYKAPLPAIQQVGLLIKFNAVILWKMITQKLSLKSLGGPISIFTTAGKASLAGVISYLSFIAYLSVTLGFINILPIPMLDGGHFMFLLLEGVRRKPISNRVYFLAFRVGLVVILLVMFQAILNDVQRFF